MIVNQDRIKTEKKKKKKYFTFKISSEFLNFIVIYSLMAKAGPLFFFSNIVHA